MPSLFSKVSQFARSPQGRRLTGKAMSFARSPEGRRKIAGFRQRLMGRG